MDEAKRTGKERECIFTGKPYKKEDFNEEHFIPKWLLKKYNLHNKNQNWPGVKKIRYGKTVVVDSEKTANSDFSRIEKNIEQGNLDEKEVYLWALKIHVGLVLRGARLKKDQSQAESEPAIDISLYEQDIEIFRNMFTVWRNSGDIKNIPGTVHIIDSPYPEGVFDFCHCLLSRSIMIVIGEKLIYANLFDMGHTNSEHYKEYAPKRIDTYSITEEEKKEINQELQAFVAARTWFAFMAHETHNPQRGIFTMTSEKSIFFVPRSRHYPEEFKIEEAEFFLNSFEVFIYKIDDDGKIYTKPSFDVDVIETATQK